MCTVCFVFIINNTVILGPYDAHWVGYIGGTYLGGHRFSVPKLISERAFKSVWHNAIRCLSFMFKNLVVERKFILYTRRGGRWLQITNNTIRTQNGPSPRCSVSKSNCKTQYAITYILLLARNLADINKWLTTTF